MSTPAATHSPSQPDESYLSWSTTLDVHPAPPKDTITIPFADIESVNMGRSTPSFKQAASAQDAKGQAGGVGEVQPFARQA